jgi:putative ABC transport system permease protein
MDLRSGLGRCEVKGLRFWRIAGKVAQRDLWSGRGHFAVALTGLAVAAAAINASLAIGSAFADRLNGDMRQWMAADAAVTLRSPPTEEQRAAIAELDGRGIERTESLETYSMASSDQAADPALVSIKEVDPRRYPWYGAVELEPSLPLDRALRVDTAIVSRTLLERLAIATGSQILLNGVAFQVTAVLTGEPDRFAAAPNAYPRVMLSAAAFERSQIARAGNAIVWRLLFRNTKDRDAAWLKAKLIAIFPDGQVLDSRDHGDSRAAAALDAALTYLGLTAWTALALGSLGAAMVTYLHVEQRLDTVAIMKVIGGRWNQILGIYLLEAAALSLTGCATGAALAVPLERIFLSILKHQTPFPIALPWQWPHAAEAAGVVLVSSLAATAIPLLALRRTAPLRILRGQVEQAAHSRAIAHPAWHLYLLGMAALAIWMVHSWRAGAAFLLGLGMAVLILMATGRGLLRVARWASGRLRQQVPATWFHGVRSLSRPRHHFASRFLALAIGIMAVAASWLGLGAVVRAIEQSLPLPGADLFVLGLGSGQTGPLLEFLAHDPDVNQPVEVVPAVMLRLSRINGMPARDSAPERWLATCTDGQPSGPVSAGRRPHPGASVPEAVMAESLARLAGAAAGDTIEFFSSGRTITARIAGLRRLDAIEEQRGGLVFPCTAFAGLSAFYEVGISVKGERVNPVRRRIGARFPSFPVIGRRELAAAIQSVARDAVWMLRASAALILAAGAAILILMAMADEGTRRIEIAILKAVGARSAQVRNALLVEFAALGTLAGLSGAVMGSLFASLLLSVVFRKAVVAWDPGVLAGATILGGMTSLAAGWAASARLLGQKPLRILRDE